MTTATPRPLPIFRRRNHGAGHSYTLYGEKIPGVTTVLNAMAKPGLINWAARTAANYAVDHWDALAEMPLTERLAEISTAHSTHSRKAMARGTRIHTFAWGLVQGRDVEVPDELASPVDAYARFLDQWGMESVYAEMPVCHTEHCYGGTLDAIVTSPKLGTVLMDVKTGGVFREVALQLAAYRHANLGLEGDEIVTLSPDAVDGCYVAQVHTDDVELIPVTADRPVWQAFLSLLAVYQWTTRAADESPIGRTLYPEEVPA